MAQLNCGLWSLCEAAIRIVAAEKLRRSDQSPTSIAVFGTLQLAHEIFLSLNVEDLVHASWTCRHWHSVIMLSGLFSKELFLTPEVAYWGCKPKRATSEPLDPERPPVPTLTVYKPKTVPKKPGSSRPQPIIRAHESVVVAKHPALVKFALKEQLRANEIVVDYDWGSILDYQLSITPFGWLNMFITQPPTRYVLLRFLFQPHDKNQACEEYAIQLCSNSGVRFGEIVSVVHAYQNVNGRYIVYLTQIVIDKVVGVDSKHLDWSEVVKE